MDFTQTVVGTLLSTSVVLAIGGFLARESFARLLDSRLERFRHGLEVDLAKRQLTIQSQIERKERQLAEFYGPIYAMLKRGRTLVRLLLDGKLDPIRDQFWVLACNAALVHPVPHPRSPLAPLGRGDRRDAALEGGDPGGVVLEDVSPLVAR
jgi:hypothetical protein